MGGVCGYIDGNVEKCSVDAGYFSNTLQNARGYIGGIAGELNGRIDICSAMFDDGLERTIDGASYMSSFSVEGNSDIGGIVGSVAGGGISNCKYDGQSISTVGFYRANVGGIAGHVNTNEVTIVEEPENSDMISKCFANVDGILYGETNYDIQMLALLYTNVGGILGFAEGDDKANASNLIAVADRVSSAATRPTPYSGDIVGRIDDDAMDFRSVYSYSSMSKSAVNTTTGAEGYVVETGTPRTITNI